MKKGKPKFKDLREIQRYFEYVNAPMAQAIERLAGYVILLESKVNFYQSLNCELSDRIKRLELTTLCLNKIVLKEKKSSGVPAKKKRRRKTI